MVAHAYNPSTVEIEAGVGGSLGYLMRLCIKRKELEKKRKIKKKNRSKKLLVVVPSTWETEAGELL